MGKQQRSGVRKCREQPVVQVGRDVNDGVCVCMCKIQLEKGANV